MGLFGIKTKKDKQIEQLKREVEWLKSQTLEPIFVTDKRDVITLCANYTVPKEMEGRLSQDHIKQILVREIANKVTDYLDIVCVDVVCDADYMKCLKVYRAKINIVSKVADQNL